MRLEHESRIAFRIHDVTDSARHRRSRLHRLQSRSLSRSTTPTDRLVIIDKLTYAGSLLNLDGALQDPRVTFVAGGHRRCRRRGARVRGASARRGSQSRGRNARRSLDRFGPRPFIDTNIVGTFVLLEAARAFVRQAEPAERDAFRFLHVSTDEVYGTLGPSGLFSEETPYAPNSPYAASKAAADHLVRASFHTYGLPDADHELLEQLRPVPVSRKADPADAAQRARRPAAADLRRRRQRPRLAACRGSLRRHSARARQGPPRRRSTTSAAATSAPTWRSSIGSAMRRRGCVLRHRTRT